MDSQEDEILLEMVTYIFLQEANGNKQGRYSECKDSQTDPSTEGYILNEPPNKSDLLNG